MSKKWFRRKKYGWGWTPATVEGWAVIGMYLVAVFAYGYFVDRSSHSVSDTLIGAFPFFLVATTALLIVSYITGEKPRWQWGEEGHPRKSSRKKRRR